MKRKSKTDNRNFIDLKPINGENPYTTNVFHKKKKRCIYCKEMFVYDHGKELYCVICKERLFKYSKRK